MVSYLDMKYIIFFYFFIFSSLGYSQSVADQVVSIRVENRPLLSVLYQLSTENDIQFYFDPKDLPVYSLEGNFESEQLYKVLQYFLNGSNLMTVPIGPEGVVLSRKEKISKEYITYLKEAWKSGVYKYPFVDELKVMNFTFGNKKTQEPNPTLSLNVFDNLTKESILGAVVKNDDFSVSDASDLNGQIKLTNLASELKLNLSYIGYHTIELNVSIYENGVIDIPMEVQSVILNEIEIVGTGSRGRLENSRVGAEVIDLQKIERIPQALGEVDIIKSLEILPGVTSVGDISSGFNVRGGNVDESLVLFNDGMIFNPTHIVGFLSAFNAESINSTTLYKGYVDGEFGNRSSAILDIKADAENVESFKGSGGVGTSLIKLYVENKIGKKIRYKISGRASYNDYLLGLIASIKIKRSNASFFDLNGSLAYSIDDNHTLLFNTYNSDDFFEFNDEFGFEWQNGHLGLKLNSKWTDSVFSKISLNKGFYTSNQFVINSPSASNFSSGVQYLKLLANVSYQLSDKGYLKSGVELINYDTDDDVLSPREESVIVESRVKRMSSQVISPFVTLNFKLLKSLTLETSIRYSNYFSKGPGNIYQYENNILKLENIESVLEFSGNDPLGKYSIIEPRASLNFKYTDNISIRAGYNKMSQNLIQISNASSALPSDFYIFSNRYIPPQVVEQYSLGLFNTNDAGSYNLSFEGFYKDYENLRSLKQFPVVILNDHLETELLKSTGSSYGVEVFVEKNKGKWVGSLSYTYSRSFRQTTDNLGALNNGDKFSSNFDIPHQLNIVASYKWLPTVSLQFAYVYKSGRPTTLPSETILQDGFLVPVYSARNQSRIPYYSRLDFSITLDMRKAKQSGFRSSFNLGFYNVLSRKNAFNVFFRRSEGGNIQPFQFSIVGTLVPNFTWNFTF